ncbi:MAG TPA: ATP-binding protein [Terriglobia bacterium]|jgi:signal transduction histidine kinase
MATEPLFVLLVDDDEDGYRRIQRLLLEIPYTSFVLDRASTFDDAAGKLREGQPDAVLIRYEIAARTGFQRLSQFAFTKAPVILLMPEDDANAQAQALQLGATDYLVKGHLDASLLDRSIRYSIAQKRLEEQLREAREQLEDRVRERTSELTRVNEQLQKADQLKDQFLAIMSHELRTPLTPILGWSRMLKTGAVGGDQLERGLDVIERNAQLEAKLVEDILDASRIVTGKLKFDFQWVNLDEILQHQVQAWQPVGQTRGITLVTDLKRVPFVWGNAQRLQQVFSNLLSNAFKFTPQGGQITISAKSIEGTVLVKVADTGAGIKPDFLPHVFERFRQADSSTTRKHGGLGLGLAIVRYLVEMHGGLISAESRGEGQGSSFTVSLPESAGCPRQEAV